MSKVKLDMAYATIRKMESELAALREELAAQKETVALFESEYSKQSISLTAAEQRNSAMSNLLEEALDSVYAEARRAETPFASRLHTGLADRIEATLNKPEEAKS